MLSLKRQDVKGDQTFPQGNPERRKAVGVLSRDMSVLQFIKDDGCLGSKIQTEPRGSVFPIWKSVQRSPRRLKFLGTTFTNQKEIVGLLPAIPEPRTVPGHVCSVNTCKMNVK